MNNISQAAALASLADWVEDELDDELSDRQYTLESVLTRLRGMAAAATAAPGAEVAARRTAAAAVLGDFRRELATAPLSRPPGREWMFRLAGALGSVLEEPGPEPAGHADPLKLKDLRDPDDTEPYCTACGEWCGLFLGLEGWRHFRGDPAPGGNRDLYVADHEPVVGWRQPGGAR